MNTTFLNNKHSKQQQLNIGAKQRKTSGGYCGIKCAQCAQIAAWNACFA